MGSNELKLRINVLDRTRAGFASAGKGLRKFGRGVKNFGRLSLSAFRAAAKGVATLGAIISATAVLSIRAFAKQEDAERRLAKTIELYGESVDHVLPKLKAQASAIQDVTGAADEDVLQMFQLGKVLGLSTSQLDGAARAAIGLSATFSRMNPERSMRAVAEALQGDVAGLREYFPALDKARSKTAQMNVVLDIFTKLGKISEERNKTLGGRFRALKGRTGDLMEKFGEAIAELLNLNKNIDRLEKRIKKFTESDAVGKWAKRIKTALKPVKEILDGLFAGDKEREKAIGKLRQAGAEVGKSFTDWIINAAPEVGAKIASAILRGMVVGHTNSKLLTTVSKISGGPSFNENLAAGVAGETISLLKKMTEIANGTWAIKAALDNIGSR